MKLSCKFGCCSYGRNGGFIADIKAMKDITYIKKGGITKLSMSQITCLITNMSDARKNLSTEEFNKVNKLFKEFRKCKTKVEMGVEGYLDTAQKIINKFDTIAPYEKYGGGNELELSFMMEDIMSTSDHQNIYKNLSSEDFLMDDNDQKYIDYIVEETNGQLDQEDAQDFIKILYQNENYGKEEALKYVEILTNKFIDKYDDFYALMKISIITGMLYPAGIVTKEESDDLGKKYTDRVAKKMGLK